MLKELGLELQNARKDRRESLDAIARPARISATYLQKLERGEVNNPSPRVLGRLAVVLDVEYLRLMELAGYLNEEELAEERVKNASIKPHPLANQQLTSEEWSAVGAFIKYLVAQRNKD
jgi:transcriptional regulator with XRE-family HTH domain